MSELYKVFLSMSLSGALMTILLLCLLPVMKKKLSRQWQYYIWLIVIARMLVPFAPRINFMKIAFQKTEILWTKIDEGQSREQNITVTPDSQKNKTIIQSNLLENNQKAIPSNLQDSQSLFVSSLTTVSKTSGFTLIKTLLKFIWQYLWLLWLMITLLLLLRKITMYASFTSVYAAGQKDIDIQQPVEDIAKKQPATQKIYEKKRVQLLIDLRSDRSFEYFNYDKKGDIGVKITRRKNGSIKKVSRIPRKKMQKIIKDLED